MPPPDTTVISQFLHPPLGLLSIEALSGNPYSGYTLLNRPAGPIGVNAFGIMWAAESWPDGYGRNSMFIDTDFDRRILRVQVYHILFDGTGVVSEFLDTNRQTGYMLFNESFPFSVGTEWQPGVVGSFYWLLAL